MRKIITTLAAAALVLAPATIARADETIEETPRETVTVTLDSVLDCDTITWGLAHWVDETITYEQADDGTLVEVFRVTTITPASVGTPDSDCPNVAVDADGNEYTVEEPDAPIVVDEPIEEAEPEPELEIDEPIVDEPIEEVEPEPELEIDEPIVDEPIEEVEPEPEVEEDDETVMARILARLPKPLANR